MKIYSIEMMTPESRIYIEPPLSKPIRFIKLLNCRLPNEWVTFKATQGVYKVNVQNGETSDAALTTILAGSYSFETLQKSFNKGPTKLVIVKTAQGNYLRSNNNVPLKLTRGLVDALGVSEQIDPNKNYPIKHISEKIVKIYCDLVEKRYSYENKVLGGYSSEAVTLRPTQLLAIAPSLKYDNLIGIEQTPINYFTITIYDEDGNLFRLINESIRIQLKINF